MSADLDRLLSDASTAPSQPVDVDALYARAQHARRWGRLVAGTCAVALLVAGVTTVLAAIRADHRVEFDLADSASGQAGQSAPGWPLRLRATIGRVGSPDVQAAETIEFGGEGWEEWVGVIAYPSGDEVAVEISTADARYGEAEDWVDSAEPYRLLEQATEEVASAPRGTGIRGHFIPWWAETRPGVAVRPAPHPLLRSWVASAAAAQDNDETAIEVEPEAVWDQRRAGVADRFDIDPAALGVRSWQTWPVDDACPADELSSCIRVTAVILEAVDVPLLVELHSEDGTTDHLEVTHLDATHP